MYYSYKYGQLMLLLNFPKSFLKSSKQFFQNFLSIYYKNKQKFMFMLIQNKFIFCIYNQKVDEFKNFRNKTQSF